MKVTAPDRRATLRDGQVVFAARGAKRAHDSSVGAGLDAKDTFPGQVGPSAPANLAIAQIGGVWQRTATSPSYTLVTTRADGFFDGLTRTLASTRGMARAGHLPPRRAVAAGADLLGRAVLSADHGLRWYLGARTQNGTDGEGVTAFADSRRFEPDRTHRVTLDGGVHGPIVTPTQTVGGPRIGRNGMPSPTPRTTAGPSPASRTPW